MKLNVLLFLAGLLTVLTAQADDGLKFIIKEKTSGQKADEHIMYVGDKHLRMEMDNQVMIYDETDESIVILKPGQKEYTELTKAEMDSLKKLMGNMQEIIEQRLKEVPPEQRSMVKKMLKQKLGSKMEAENQAPVEFSKTGKSKSINGWPSQEIIGKREGEKVYEHWVTDYSNANIKPGELSVMESFTAHMKSLVEQLPVQGNTGNFESMHASLSRENKIPVRTIQYKKGKKKQQNDIQSIDHVELSENLFTIPEGYKESEGMF